MPPTGLVHQEHNLYPVQDMELTKAMLVGNVLSQKASYVYYFPKLTLPVVHHYHHTSLKIRYSLSQKKVILATEVNNFFCIPYKNYPVGIELSRRNYDDVQLSVYTIKAANYFLAYLFRYLPGI